MFAARKCNNVCLSVRYEGHVCIIVNVASKCGLTATNYKELNELYDEYAESKGNVRAVQNVAGCLIKRSV